MAGTLNDFALFPLGIIVFPGEIQPLHILEEKHKQLINDMGNDKEMFGIAYVKDGKICLYGSGVVIHKILATSSTGEMDILVKGVIMFVINDMKEQLPGKLYAGGKVRLLEKMNDIANPQLIKKFRSYKLQLSRINKDLEATSGIITSNRVLDIAGQLPLENEEKYCIIKLNNKQQREKYLLEKLKFLQVINLKLKEVGHRFYLN